MERSFIDIPRENLPPQTNRKPFSDAVRAGDTLYVSGRIGLDATGKPPQEAAEEARLLMESLRSVVESAGMQMSDLVQITIFTPDVTANYATFNSVYLGYFGDRLPARAFIGSGPLLYDARFELTAIAVASAGKA